MIEIPLYLKILILICQILILGLIGKGIHHAYQGFKLLKADIKNGLKQRKKKGLPIDQPEP